MIRRVSLAARFEPDAEIAPVPRVIRDATGSRGARAWQLDVRPRVLLADDHAGLLMALQRLLERSCAVVGTVRTGADALKATWCLQPDVLVTDVSLPDIDGLEVCRRVRAGADHTRVVVITAADDLEIEERAFELGASGFVLKFRMGENLMPAIERALVSSDPTNPPGTRYDAGALAGGVEAFNRISEDSIRQEADIVRDRRAVVMAPPLDRHYPEADVTSLVQRPPHQ